MENIYIAPPPAPDPEPDGPLRFLTSPSKGGLAGILVLLLAVVAGSISLCSTPALPTPDPLKEWMAGDHDHERYSSTEVADAISWVLRLNEVTDHRWWEGGEWRDELASAFVTAGETYDQPQLLLAGMAYRETFYDPKRVGPAGESGIMQVGRFCRADPECRETCSGSTLADDVGCGSCCLHLGQRKCRSLYAGVTHYLSGRCSARRSGNPVRVERAAQARFRWWMKAHRVVRGDVLRVALGESSPPVPRTWTPWPG
jgi:hypothetical protein